MSKPAAASSPVQAEQAPARPWLALIAIYSGISLVGLDGAIVNVALPTLAETLRVSSSASVAVATSYQLAVLISLLPFAAAGESYGPRRMFVGGMALFIVASGLCALSPNLSFLVAARFAQGLGGGVIMALTAMLLRYTVPPERLASAIGWNAVTVALAGAAGPSVGALILSVASWPWLFAVNVPIGLVALAAAQALPAERGTGRPIDAISALASAGMFALYFAGAGRLVHAPATGAAMIAVASLCLYALIRRESGRLAPLIPIDLFAEPAFRGTVFASACTFCAQTMSYVALPFHFQTALGASVLSTGAYMTAWPIAIVVSASLSGRLSARLSAPSLCLFGTLLLGASLAAAAAIPLSAGVAPLIAALAVAGLGFGVFQPANNRLLLMSAPKARSGAAGGVQGTTRLVGQTFGATLVGAFFALLPSGEAPRIGVAAAALFALIAATTRAVSARRA